MLASANDLARSKRHTIAESEIQSYQLVSSNF